MSLLRCVYVSSARLDLCHAHALAQQIVDHAVVANHAAQITGTLMFDGSRFAQLIEGPEANVARLVARLASDRRHEDIVFLERNRIAERLFDGFSMAYCGNSVFVKHSIARPLADSPGEADYALQQLIRLMLEFVR